MFDFTENKNRVNKEEPSRIPSLPDINKTLSTQSSNEEPPSSPSWRRPGSFRNLNTGELVPPKTLSLSTFTHSALQQRINLLTITTLFDLNISLQFFRTSYKFSPTSHF